MICGNCRQDHPSIDQVLNCHKTGDSSGCRHGLPSGQCICTWARGIERAGTHRYVVTAKWAGFCSVCMTEYSDGERVVKSPYTWGRWIHYRDDCIPMAHEVWSDTTREYQTALDPKPWLEELSTPPVLLEREDEVLLDPRDEIEDTCDELQALLISEGIDESLITEWRAMLPDVIERTILMAVAQLPEENDLMWWQEEVESMHADAEENVLGHE